MTLSSRSETRFTQSTVDRDFRLRGRRPWSLAGLFRNSLRSRKRLAQGRGAARNRGQNEFSLAAQRTASRLSAVLEATPSLRLMRSRWASTVLRLMCRRRAIS